MRVVFYQNMASPHQADTIRALQERHGVEARVVVERMSEARRKVMGWPAANFGGVEVVEPPSMDAFVREVDRPGPVDTFHMFSGFHAYPRVSAALSHASGRGLRIGILAESPSGVTWRAPFRDVRTRWHALRWGRRVQCLLTTGELGVRWYCSRGFEAAKVFDFGYFVNAPTLGAISPRPDTVRAVSLISVGMSPCKRVPDVVRSLARSHHRNWTIDLVGDGPERARAADLAQRLGVIDRVRFLGTLPHGETLAAIARSDVLILASSWDGWGVVVNEALMLGVRVVCSSCAGAADLIVSTDQGRVFDARSMAAMGQAIDATLAEGPTTPEARVRLVRWADWISAERAAGYLVEILEHTEGRHARPAPPWRHTRPKD